MTTKSPEDPIRRTRDARKRLRITQLELARRVGCSEAQVSKIETGRCQPEQWLREAIARELGLPSYEVGN